MWNVFQFCGLMNELIGLEYQFVCLLLGIMMMIGFLVVRLWMFRKLNVWKFWLVLLLWNRQRMGQVCLLVWQLLGSRMLILGFQLIVEVWNWQYYRWGLFLLWFMIFRLNLLLCLMNMISICLMLMMLGLVMLLMVVISGYREVLLQKCVVNVDSVFLVIMVYCVKLGIISCCFILMMLGLVILLVVVIS